MAIQVADLTKRFGKAVAVDGISFSIARGSATALLGPNGAGKTTTLAMLLGLMTPSSGSIRVLGTDMLRHRYQVLGRMNYASPYIDLPQRLTVRENLNVYGRLYGVRNLRTRIKILTKELDLERFMERPYREMSAGQRTRVALAKALLNEPEVLLLDEPTASLDPDTADRIRGLLEAYRGRTGATLLLASHNMPEVERLCDRVMMLRSGRIVDDGTPEGLASRYGRRNLEEVFLDVARRV
ncbi:ABC transporter ATP-binding protein [Thioalkalivibrio sp.]|uniref:ABC transporter ATP-binding protein n=1 Tax=Thioalkalivibrio sp. TaxID=2093813 RepID=UPI0012D6190E|nr:ABC transporter ATP-binding protein [Thioalkalivibrio sp.]TVP79542.1 MAG: ABC transporter ATP-binding protein [Thioalkalivibrio sp.]